MALGEPIPKGLELTGRKGAPFSPMCLLREYLDLVGDFVPEELGEKEAVERMGLCRAVIANRGHPSQCPRVFEYDINAGSTPSY